MQYLLLTLCAVFCTGCFAPAPPQPEVEARVEMFKDLIKQGWKVKEVDGKIILVKQVESGMLLSDVFGVAGD